MRMLKLNPQCDDMRKWGLLGVITPWGWSPCEWDSLTASALWRHREKMTIRETKKCVLARHWIGQHFDLGLPASRTMRNKFLLFITHPIYSSWLEPPEWTETISLIRVDTWPHADFAKWRLLSHHNDMAVLRSSPCRRYYLPGFLQ